MAKEFTSVDEYIHALEDEKREAIESLREVILAKIPAGFKETMSYGMIGYVVPFDIYPSGYHCNTKLPLPFLNIAAQKNFVALYHMGLYADEQLMKWFVEAYPQYSDKKLDIGKSCIRFKKTADIPFALIGDLVSKMTVKRWIELYESNYKSK